MTEGEFSESGQKEGKSVERGLIAQEFSSSNSTDVPERKRTELGPIPEEWVIGTLRNYLKRPPSYGINAAAVPYDENLPTYIRITDIDDEGRFSPNPPVSVKNPHSGKYFLEEGDLVFARTGASVGKSYKYSISDGTLVYAGFLIRITPDHKKLNPTFLAHYAHTQKYWEWVDSISLRSGQPGINGSEYGALRIPVPPIKEQRAIAATLSDADALIDSLDRLIAKKRAIKQAAMQQLLTGETRLPGFESKWEKKRLGDIGNCVRGVSYDPEKDLESFESGKTFILLKADHVQQGGVITDNAYYIDQDKVLEKQELKTGDVLICMANGSRRLVGKAAEFRQFSPKKYTFGAFMGRYRITSESANKRFVGNLFQTDDYRKYLDIRLSGSSINNLKPSDIEEAEFFIPEKNEQEAIAQVLSDMDEEIAALEKRRDKARQIKQGMMQELLTGRVRLVGPEPA